MHFEVTAIRTLTRSGAIKPIASCHPRSVSQHRDPELSNNLYKSDAEFIAAPANCPSNVEAIRPLSGSAPQGFRALYTAEERARRDATKWTLVQGILAPVQFVAFAISVALIARYLATGEGVQAATLSIVIKTMLLYAIMITGAIWEREVFGVYLFAPAFFWEDVFSFLVIGLHTAYLAMLIGSYGDTREQMLLALAAYAAYAINATQFLLKLRAARRDERLANAMQRAAL